MQDFINNSQLDFQKISQRNNISIEDITSVITSAKKSMIPITKHLSVVENTKVHQFKVVRVGVGLLDTCFGKIYQFEFEIDDKWQKYSVLVKAQLNDDLMPVFNDSKMLLRIDSGCQTGQLFGDGTCDCQKQLFLAMEKFQEGTEGIIIHIPNQDGRGMGLPFKLATLSIQSELGLDTVQAAKIISPNGTIDSRNYLGVICILKFFEISTTKNLVLLTNNPQKAKPFSENSFHDITLFPVNVPVTEKIAHHLLAKKKFLGHLIEINDYDHLDG